MPAPILAIETSCDETAVAIFQSGAGLLAAHVASQASIHEAYGGVVPEVASRNHLANLPRLLNAAFETAGIGANEVGAFAATSGPGLATSLMIGASAAKGMAIAGRKPYIAVNHLEGHLLSPFFGSARIRPSVSLIVSGGHTLLVDVSGFGEYRILGRTVDDAAGEAFDKAAKLLGLPYPGGPEIDRLAAAGDPKRHTFPRGMLLSRDSNFSFSGIKTSLRYLLPQLQNPNTADLCASFQEAIVDVLVYKTIDAAKRGRRERITVSGGVSCNSRLRARMQDAADASGLELILATPGLSTDNAAMIAHVAAEYFQRGHASALEEDIDPNLPLKIWN